MPTISSAGKDLQEAGGALTSSGNSLLKVAPLLASNGKITRLVLNIKSTIRAIQPILTRIADLLAAAGRALDAIKIPTVSPRTTRIDVLGTRFTVMTGLNVEQKKLFPQPAKALKDAATELRKLRVQLAATETSLGQIHRELPGLSASFKDTGAQLVKGGGRLNQAGTTLAEIP